MVNGTMVFYYGVRTQMSTISVSTASTEQTTVQSAHPNVENQSANTSMTSEKSDSSRPSLHYPTVCVQVPRAPASQLSSPPSGVSYAVPFPKPIQYSAAQLHYENMKHRCKMLDAENQRLMRVQNELISDANRRVEKSKSSATATFLHPLELAIGGRNVTKEDLTRLSLLQYISFVLSCWGEMHVNEIRMLKEDNKKLTATNKVMNDSCPAQFVVSNL
ncbi:hypothetical protein NECAME_11127 [Necator americanus]|uniref:Uncharacterized protein n=1 Tax=Necator americanus TaxID=51031 RepID=W2T641_NECAM|nr:hypothetical protein NECAME_11127 [Necator americanus]ETN77343.1 hypothetical protein NECAME_11127 [Necator americanus]